MPRAFQLLVCIIHIFENSNALTISVSEEYYFDFTQLLTTDFVKILLTGYTHRRASHFSAGIYHPLLVQINLYPHSHFTARVSLNISLLDFVSDSVMKTLFGGALSKSRCRLLVVFQPFPSSVKIIPDISAREPDNYGRIE